MLRELRIENLLLIERAELRLDPGLNVLTGETGAGKTVLAHSLDLLMGGKAKRNIVRPGADEAWVEGVFDLPTELADDPELKPILERLPADTEELILGRRVFSSGRTSAFLGGRAASAADLRQITARLITFYGQHEHRRLTISSVQTGMVDAAGGSRHADLLQDYRAAWTRFRRLESELDELAGESGRERDLDLYRYELEEIEAAAPVPGEPEVLEAERIRLERIEEMQRATAEAASLLRGEQIGPGAGTLGELAAVRGLLAPLRGVDPGLDDLDRRLESLALELDDVGQDLGSRSEASVGDPERLTVVGERIDLLSRLERKHGGSIEQVLDHAERCRAEIDRLEGGAAREEELRGELDQARAGLGKLAVRLSQSRTRAAEDLAERISIDLDQLAMAGAEFTIRLEALPDGPGPGGLEAAEFILAPNPGMAAQPLRDTASGGELSRVMLALAASGDGNADGGRTLVFDEIDAGIGGNTAGAVGDRLRKVATTRQVIAITHLPQVAARAEAHFAITKEVGEEPATARVESLVGDDVVGEIRRMMGAEAGDATATRHAAELLSTHR
ncbi:MAG: DNA repair protein RecN [Solirubrobacterales bacterium]|nr:DNA repair protein RecN [Solirubrobacterales bacterium]